MFLSENAKNNLIEYFHVTSQRQVLLLELEKEFRPILDQAEIDKDTTIMLEMIDTLPKCEFTKEVYVKMKKILNR